MISSRAYSTIRYLPKQRGYWNFFYPITVTATHPEDMITSLFPHGFESIGANSLQMRIDSPGENINLGFWMIGNARVQPRSTLGFAILLVIGGYVIGVSLLIAAVVFIVLGIVRLVKKRDNPPPDSQNL